jgi:hypothetical protein
MTDRNRRLLPLKLPKLPGLPQVDLADGFSRIGSRIDTYFFRPGGVYSIAICRVALFSYFWLHIIGDAQQTYFPNGAGAYLANINLSAYYPKSIVWFLFPTTPPPAAFIDAVLLAAKISTAMAIFGVMTRPAMIVSTLSCLFLASLIFSWEPLWSHPYNSGLIAGLAFMFGRAGDVLSVDSVFWRAVIRPVRTDRDVYWWPVILGLFGVAMVYFGGFYAKWSTPDFSYNFSWIFSDNLRNSVALPWLIRGQELPWNADLIANNQILWKLSAFGHMATQFLPILAMFALRKPILRAIEGGIFVAGAFLLLFMMGMWNPQWIVLAAFFVDWDYFLSKARLVGEAPTASPAKRAPTAARWIVIIFAFAFMALNLWIIFTRIDDRGGNRLYPFSSMTFYSNVAASKPYSEHLHYPFPYGELLIETPAGTHKWFCERAIASSYVVTFNLESDAMEKAKQQLGAITAAAASTRSAGKSITDCNGSVYDITTINNVDLYASILNIPPFPEKARFDVGYRALVGRYEAEGGRYVAAAAGNMHRDKENEEYVLQAASEGLDVDRYEIYYANDPWKNRSVGPIRPLNGAWEGDVFTFDRAAYDALPAGWYPIVLRVIEKSGKSYDFFSGVLYK